MQLTQDNQEHNHIQRCEAGSIMVDDTVYTASLIISPDEIIANIPIRHIADFNIAKLQIIIDLQPDVVLLGTGHQQHFVTPNVIEFFTQQQLGVEVMPTAAACRTFNILLAEGRRVVAGLIID